MPIGIAAVQTAIEYEYRFTEYRFAEYEYDEIRCEDGQVVCLIAFNSQPQAYWIHRHLRRPVRLRLTVKRNGGIVPGTCHFAPATLHLPLCTCHFAPGTHAINPGG
ncbi:MAG: hypothetical protein NTV29_07715 [Planctomycetota bacterium]|nr:hypothetical protein [Planctomycetota bacterium]